MRHSARCIMLVPSLSCSAQCAYCFGPNTGPVMDEATLSAGLEWMEATTLPNQTLEVCLHGGEPLQAGPAWHQRALALLKARFRNRLCLSLQSNLWLLDDAFCDLFCEHDVSLGVSLDGPEAINDAQRGTGYFTHTMSGIETARRHGLSVNVLCTFTHRSVSHWREVFDFFLREGLSFSFHGAVPMLGKPMSCNMAITSNEFTDLVIDMFDYYMEHIQHIRVSTFDQIARSAAGNSSLCTFSPCLGRYLTISSDGGIYPCNRFIPHSAWRLGTVQNLPTLEQLTQTQVWQRLQSRETDVKQECGECPYFANCTGGCAYHAIAAGTDRRDGFCAAYKRIFAHLTEKAVAQVFSDDNLEAVIKKGLNKKRGLLHKGPLLQIMRGGAHPAQISAKAWNIAASVAIAVSASPIEAFKKLERVGLAPYPDRARITLERMWQNRSQLPLGHREAYIHITNACNLSCDHCYADGHPTHAAEFMPVGQVNQMLQGLISASFSRVKITGGEPLVHPHWSELQQALTTLRQSAHQTQLILRTNLIAPLSPVQLHALTKSVDHIIVSVDGDQTSHDERRGIGAYAKTVANLHTLAQLDSSTRISLAATITTEQWGGKPGQAVRNFAAELNFDVRFRCMLPLGRAADWILQPEFSLALLESEDAVNIHPGMRVSCSLGLNLHIAVDGACYPCFALLEKNHFLGNFFDEGLTTILKRNTSYAHYTVDTNQQCRLCVWRYLCGGHCRVWCCNSDLDSSPKNCAALQAQANFILHSALKILKISQERWQEAGLPYVQNESNVSV